MNNIKIKIYDTHSQGKIFILYLNYLGKKCFKNIDFRNRWNQLPGNPWCMLFFHFYLFVVKKTLLKAAFFLTVIITAENGFSDQKNVCEDFNFPCEPSLFLFFSSLSTNGKPIQTTMRREHLGENQTRLSTERNKKLTNLQQQKSNQTQWPFIC